jgi:5S rRNA maturation endonuclease (ribonuclease M5)
MTPREKVFPRLKKLSQTGANTWKACCPSHNDENPSLSITINSEGWIIFKCFADCTFESIHRALGLEAWELCKSDEEILTVEGPGGKRKVVAEYNYTDEKGRLIYQSIRYEPKDFAQRRPDGNGGWIWKEALKGIDRILYRLPELLAAVASNEIVYFVEGEKDADNLAKLGVTTTTSAGGVKSWDKKLTLDLTNARIVILPDNDAAGKDYARKIAADLNGVSQSTRIVDLPNLPQKGDVSDWIESGGTKEELEKLVDSSETWKPPTKPGEAGYKMNFSIEQIEKVLTSPPIYYVSIQNFRVKMTIDQLLSFGKFKNLVAQDTNLVPDMTNHSIHWGPYVNERLNNARIDTPAPEEAGEEAMIWYRVCKYLDGKSEEDETALGDLRGPYSNERLYYFHGPTMHQFLSSRGMRIEATELWNIIRRRGATATQKWVKNSEGKSTNRNTWTLEKKIVNQYVGGGDAEPAPKDADS